MRALSAIEAHGVSRRLGRMWALIDVDLQAAPGAGVLVAGRNGAGKTTLLRVLGGALRTDRGKVTAGGETGTDALRRRTALLSHSTYCYEALSALENLRVAARLAGRKADRTTLMAALEAVELGARADSPVQTFSAGMRKRLSIARVLLQEPEILLLDEPYGQLDPPGFGMIDDLVRKSRSKGTTVIIASHQLSRAAGLCDSGIVLDRGRVVWSGPAQALPLQGGLVE